MRSPAGSVKFSVVLRASTACLLALGVSACSSETMRFTDTPFASPFKTAEAAAPGRDPATTGSIGRSASTAVYAAPAPAMTAVRSQPLPPPQSAVALRSAAPQPMAGNASGWSAQGGTPIVVAQGETLDMISSRYGVPRAALISANGLSSPTIAPGSRLTIPVYNAAGATPAAAPAPRQQFAQAPAEVRADMPRSDASRFVTGPAPAASLAPVRPAAPVQASRTSVQAAADTKASAAQAKAAAAAEAKAKAEADALAMRESRARFAAEAKAKAAAKASTPVAATPVAKPAVAAVAPKPVAATRPASAEVKPARPVEAAKPVVVASAPAAEPKASAVPKSAPEPATTASLPKAEETSEKADFRWPARGRVIAGFSGRGGNEGINIAVPEGTPVKAAEGGTVAYAGNELKGYGNLVLIRHPNGYVSAYAHNGEIKVKRGETVKRGQVVASSGQTGNVSSPQLHFELRKGSAPVDPTPYLNN
ncbi:LysM peptidoglycan-binding domain-containing M23 family metallopeptidase [Bosea sp. (in: a-proteobacteria)]|uniref:LysM peptidoglycan-binding domain-containing M23 family metallopeptidase n=1 Tax=Bosea sp. (in: a-proteobacteria) TaxID=1871050 RepID=UPI00273649FA|nr:LysM peptidoglycan-binding domain-containing M23 family metallopeptidase [Bosea sp. (in: a-proteobacteria)]MDP3407996.1 LysM peptidoglycan-binding domain-containing M23 family metallopeptidase [Bosea sp. (in: a-proteobacteria)]